MKILWIVNIIMPELAEELKCSGAPSGTWLIDIADRLASYEDISLAIACVHGNSYQKIVCKSGVQYYLLPGNGKNMLFYTKTYEKLWKQVNSDFQPDIVHVHGTEYSHGLSFLRACPNVKSVVSIQGLLNRIKDVDFGGLPASVFLWNRTLKQNLHLNGELELHHIHKKNAKYETEILQRVHNINCVNTWDSALCKSINPSLNVFKLEYNLRNEFYQAEKWNIDNIRRHTIFTNPGGTPLKGLHQLILAGALLKEKYPDLVIRVPGMGNNGKLIINSAYAKYISKLINKTEMDKHIEFLGKQTAQEMMNGMRSANVVVIPSAIEGTSLVLRESMYLGCPCIASFRGGMADFISDKIDGFLYDYQEYPYLAERIDRLFESDELCQQFSRAAILKAEQAHDRQYNTDAYINMYEKIKGDRK